VTGAGHAGPMLEAHAAAVDAAYQRSSGARWEVTAEVFAAAVAAAVRKRFGGAVEGAGAEPARGTVQAFIASLHVDDLALACACAAGHAAAWDHFVLTYRPELYRAARAIAGESEARELADSLYAELFGLPGADGARRSLLTYYHGRSKLGTWLRSVLSQRHVDGIRAARRLTSLDDPDDRKPEPVAPSFAVEPDAADRMRIAATCVSEALAGLDAGSRLRLAYYYVHGLTLAEAGRLFGEHEATASRKLEKARTALRGRIETSLAARGVRVADVESWGDVATRAWDAALADALGVGAPGGPDLSPEVAGAADPQGAAQPSFKGKRTP
jgi:RNA polymerase sigma-70 factor (ECF subfamily)